MSSLVLRGSILVDTSIPVWFLLVIKYRLVGARVEVGHVDTRKTVAHPRSTS